MSAGIPIFEWRPTRPGSVAGAARALPLLRAAVAARPEEIDRCLALARALYDCGRLPEILDVLAPWERGAATPPAAAFHLGRAAMRLHDNVRAVPLLRMAADGKVPLACGELSRALLQAGDLDGAEEAAEKQLESAPAHSRAQKALTVALLQKGEPQRLYDWSLEQWGRGVRTAQILAARAQAASMLGREQEFETLMSPAGWFATSRPELGEDFPECLAREIVQHNSLVPSYSHKPTRGDVSRVDYFEAAEGVAARRFIVAMQAAVESYLGERAAFAEHPLMAGWPRRARIESWSLCMGRDGYEEWHVHSHAWLSGVYYARIPEVAREPGSRAGCIEFGKGLWALGSAGFAPWTVAPESGMLLLFPGYYPHRTWPTGVDGLRICAAFNVLGVADD